jgi:uncharacterized membrane protein
MSDEATLKKLEVASTFKDGITIGVRNLGPILVNVLLYILTCWIPYLNIGSTIGLSVGIIVKASRGEVIGMTEIFDPRYRKYIGEFFLTTGLVYIGVFVGLLLALIPGIVLSIAWSLSLLLVIDKEKNPMEAISLSNNLTYGYKWPIFGAYFLAWLIIYGDLRYLVLYRNYRERRLPGVYELPFDTGDRFWDLYIYRNPGQYL